MNDQAKYFKAIVDESVSATQVTRFKLFIEKSGLHIHDYLFISEKHPGIPDRHILQNLIDSSTILLTTDRPFHNKVLSTGFKSFYITKDQIICTPLTGITIKTDPKFPEKHILKTDYRIKISEMAQALLPESPKQQEKLRTKRRRIRNHFGGIDNIGGIAVTVSWTSTGDTKIIGVHILVSSNCGMKAIMGSESYTIEKLDKNMLSESALCYACALVAQLMFTSISTTIYYDSQNIRETNNLLTPTSSVLPGDFFGALRNDFTKLDFVPVAKGNHLEILRRKLVQLRIEKSNELLNGNFWEMYKRFIDRKKTV